MALGLEKNKEKTIEDIKNDLEKDKSKHPFHDDLLNLKSIAETLSDIIANTKDPFVYSVNSPYGTGKTFFLRRLHCLLEQKQCLVVSYNAWESDFYSDPLSALLGEFQQQITAKEFKSVEKEITELTASIGFSFLSIINGNIHCKKTPKISDTYQKYKNQKENFIIALKKFTANLEFPLVCIIDELDRCRPDYAIQTLEIIKHFFNIPNITFVIGVDRKQIESTVRVLYGSNIDTCCDEYLRKFIDQDFYLPKPSSMQYIENLCRKHLSSVILPFCWHNNFFSIYQHDSFASILEKKRKLNFFRQALSKGQYDTDCAPIEEQFINTTIDLITAYVDALSEYFVFSLRKQEQFIISLKILFSLLSDKDILLPELACLLTAIKLHEPSMLDKPNKTIFQILLYKQPYDDLRSYPELAKLFNKSEGNIKLEKIEQIEQATTENGSDLNSVKFWHHYIAGHEITGGNNYVELQAYLNNINGLSAIKKYLQLTKQLSLLENQ
ncbi:hypothetical protein MASR1M68_12680 [Elusimicrobiota bacterium]